MTHNLLILFEKAGVRVLGTVTLLCSVSVSVLLLLKKIIGGALSPPKKKKKQNASKKHDRGSKTFKKKGRERET